MKVKIKVKYKIYLDDRQDRLESFIHRRHFFKGVKENILKLNKKYEKYINDNYQSWQAKNYVASLHIVVWYDETDEDYKLLLYDSINEIDRIDGLNFYGGFQRQELVKIYNAKKLKFIDQLDKAV